MRARFLRGVLLSLLACMILIYCLHMGLTDKPKVIRLDNPWQRQNLITYQRGDDSQFHLDLTKQHADDPSRPKLSITRIIDQPIPDSLIIRLNCTASFTSLPTSDLVKMKWTGPGITQKSLWVHSVPMTREGNNFVSVLYFRALLVEFAGVYTCEVSYQSSGYHVLLTENFTVDDTFRGLINSRNTQSFVDTENKESKWFPSAHMCGGDQVWQEYAEFHHKVVTGQEKAKYLIYDCTRRKCGGYGNRIEGLTVLLVFAIITKRVLLIRFTCPVDIRDYLAPNAIQWDYVPPIELSKEGHYLINTRFFRFYNMFEAALLSSNSSDILSVRINFGFYYHLVRMDEGLLNKMISIFHLKTQYDLVLLYGCANNYLFKELPKTTQQIESMQTKLGLIPGKYVSLHIRTHLGDGAVQNPLHLKFPWLPMFECAELAAKSLGEKYNLPPVPIYLGTDHQSIKDYALEHYPDQIIISQAPIFQIDNTIYTDANSTVKYDQGFTGLLLDIVMISRAGVIVRSMMSTLSELMGVLEHHPPSTNLQPFYYYPNRSACIVQ